MLIPLPLSFRNENNKANNDRVLVTLSIPGVVVLQNWPLKSSHCLLCGLFFPLGEGDECGRGIFLFEGISQSEDVSYIPLYTFCHFDQLAVHESVTLIYFSVVAVYFASKNVFCTAFHSYFIYLYKMQFNIYRFRNIFLYFHKRSRNKSLKVYLGTSFSQRRIGTPARHHLWQLLALHILICLNNRSLNYASLFFRPFEVCVRGGRTFPRAQTCTTKQRCILLIKVWWGSLTVASC